VQKGGRGLQDQGAVPTTLRLVVIAGNGIFILSAVAAISLARDFLIPIVLAFFIALTFRPSVRSLARRGIPAWVSTTGFAVSFSTVAGLAAYAFSRPIAAWIADAPAIQKQFVEKVRGLRHSLDGLVSLSANLQEAAESVAQPATQEVVVRDTGLSTVVMVLANYPLYGLAMLGAALVLAIFFMASGDLFYEKLIRVLPNLSDKKTALRIVYDVEHEVSNYLLSLAAINVGVGILVAVAFQLLGMPTPWVWGLLALILNFIPYLGPIAGVALSGMVAIVVFDTLTYAILVPAAYVTIVGLETQIMSPAIMSRRLQINAVAILLSLAFWAWAWGIAGIVLAVPLLVTLRVFCSHLPSLWGLGEFLTQSNDENQGTPP
jgi:predicted PurR-regulated permease PerM